MTPEFLQDIAATTPEGAMLYSLNVENNVEFADATDAGGNLRDVLSRTSPSSSLSHILHIAPKMQRNAGFPRCFTALESAGGAVQRDEPA